MFKIKKSRKFVAILLVMVVLVSSHMAYGVSAQQRNSGTDFVAQHLAERGITREEAGLAPSTGTGVGTGTTPPATSAAPAAPAAAATAPGGFTAGRGMGGFTPSTRVPHANTAARIRRDAAVAPTVRGWITIPNTNIDFPVNLSSTSNAHYLYRHWQGEDFTGRLNWRNWNQFPDTATYLDFRTTIGTTWGGTSRNINVYAHNWTNLRNPLRIGNNPADRMFAQLKSYTNVEWAAANPHIYFSTPEMEGIWRVFAVGYAHTTPFFFYNNPNPSRSQMDTIINEWRARSHINFNVDVNADDRLLTLTTCTRIHGEMLTQRYVVVARLLRPGESETDVVTATRNPNIRHPDFSQPVNLPAGEAARAAVAAAQGITSAPAAAPAAQAAAPAAPAANQTPAAAAAAQGAPPTLGTPPAAAAPQTPQSNGTRLAG
ncbi:MAG: class B sortase [Oscillospiraceae bacterium]|nr:class B sortase [Oscillospiraceae bacterium]